MSEEREDKSVIETNNTILKKGLKTSAGKLSFKDYKSKCHFFIAMDPSATAMTLYSNLVFFLCMLQFPNHVCPLRLCSIRPPCFNLLSRGLSWKVLSNYIFLIRKDFTLHFWVKYNYCREIPFPITLLCCITFGVSGALSDWLQVSSTKSISPQLICVIVIQIISKQLF